MDKQTYNPTPTQLMQILTSGEVESNNFRRLSQWRRRWKRLTGNHPTSKSYQVIINSDGPVWVPSFY